MIRNMLVGVLLGFIVGYHVPLPAGQIHRLLGRDAGGKALVTPVDVPPGGWRSDNCDWYGRLCVCI